MAAFPDDLVLEILSRVPAKSLCRFKCVSTHWLALIDHPEQRKKLPQSMAGFFYTSTKDRRPALCFFDIGRHSTSPTFAFQPNHQRLDLLDGCNGLLLLCGWYSVSQFRYVVCNPATEQWVELPDRSQAGKVATVGLGFDAAVSSHFHVFVLLLVDDYRPFVKGLDMYSSETKRWLHKDRMCQPLWMGFSQSATVFLNGHLHFRTFSLLSAPRVATVDTKGETWLNFDRPGDMGNGFIQLSQGRLHYALFAKDKHESDGDIRLEVHAMDDYETKEWTMKHSIKVSHIFEGIHVDTLEYFDLIAIHPNCNLIFFTVGWNKSLVCYNIDHRQAKLITDLGYVRMPYVPYVPMYSELRSLHM